MRIIPITVAALSALLVPPADVGAQSDAALDTDATLTVAWPVGPIGFDPHTLAFQPAYPFQAPVIENLIYYAGPGELEPGLAEAWMFAEDGSYLELTLRQGIEFHDGTAFDAEAVKANIERAKTVEASAVTDALGAIDTVEIVDDHTVRLMLTFPDAALPASLATNAGAMISPASFEDPEVDQNPVGTGAYRLESAEFGDRALYTRIGEYGDHWDPEAGKVATLEIVGIGDTNAMINAVRSGEVDAGYLDASAAAQAAPMAEDADDLELYAYESENRSALLLNRTDPALADARVRQALNYAIDRPALIDNVLGGTVAPAWQLFLEGNPGHVPELDEHYAYDPDQARQLLEEAGYGDGLTLGPIIVAGYLTDQAEVVQEMLADVGVDLELQVTGLEQTDEQFEAERTPGVFDTLGNEVDPGLFIERRLIAADHNFEGVSDEFAATADEARDGTLSDDERNALYQELNRTYVEEAWDVLVAQFGIFFLSNTSVEGLADMQYTDLAIWDPRHLGVLAES